jgi:hypothetical protein
VSKETEMPRSKTKAKPKKVVCCPLYGNADQKALEMVRFHKAMLIFCHSCDEVVLVQNVTGLVSKGKFAS